MNDSTPRPRRRKLWVVLPAFNEEADLPRLLDRIGQIGAQDGGEVDHLLGGARIAQQEDDVFTAENLAALRRITDEISRLPGVRGVTSLARVTSFRFVPADDWIEVRPFIEDVPSDPAQLASLRARALANPVYRQSLVSSDARTAALSPTVRKLISASAAGGTTFGATPPDMSPTV